MRGVLVMNRYFRKLTNIFQLEQTRQSIYNFDLQNNKYYFSFTADQDYLQDLVKMRVYKQYFYFPRYLVTT